MNPVTEVSSKEKEIGQKNGGKAPKKLHEVGRHN